MPARRRAHAVGLDVQRVQERGRVARAQMRLCSAACAARANSPYQSMRPWVQVKWTNSHGGLTRTGGLRQQMLRCCMRVKVLMMTHVPPLSEEGLCRLLECSEALVCLALLPPPTSSPGEPSPHAPLPPVCLSAQWRGACASRQVRQELDERHPSQRFGCAPPLVRALTPLSTAAPGTAGGGGKP